MGVKLTYFFFHQPYAAVVVVMVSCFVLFLVPACSPSDCCLVILKIYLNLKIIIYFMINLTSPHFSLQLNLNASGLRKRVLKVAVHTLEGKYADYPTVVSHQNSQIGSFKS